MSARTTPSRTSRSAPAKPPPSQQPSRQLPVPAIAAAAGFVACWLLQSARQWWRQRQRRAAAGAAAVVFDWRAESNLTFAAARQGATLNLALLNRSNPAGFYAPRWSNQPPDCCAVVDGLSLPLHSGPLAAQCQILQDLIAAYKSGELASGSAGLDLSPMFKGASWQEAACLLRLIYSSPREAAPANLAVLAAAGLLPGMARLAHCLDCQRVLAAVDEFLQDTMERARLAELIVAAQVSQACNSGLKEDVLNRLAQKLAAAAPAAALPQLQLPLTALDSATLAHLLRRTLREVGRQRQQGSDHPLQVLCNCSSAAEQAGQQATVEHQQTGPQTAAESQAAAPGGGAANPAPARRIVKVRRPRCAAQAEGAL